MSTKALLIEGFVFFTLSRRHAMHYLPFYTFTPPGCLL
jgi:hypothetical protein